MGIEALREYGAMITTCMARFERRLQEVGEKLRELTEGGDDSPAGDGEDSLQVLEDRASMLECINICRQAQREINDQIRLLTEAESKDSHGGERDTEPVVVKPMLQGWRDRFDVVAEHLERRPFSAHNPTANKTSQSRHKRRLELEHEQQSLREQLTLYQEFSRVIAEQGMVVHDVSAAASGFQSIRSNPGQGLVANRVHAGCRAVHMLGVASEGDFSGAVQAFVAIHSPNQARATVQPSEL